jgi:hypothetical protein
MSVLSGWLCSLSAPLRAGLLPAATAAAHRTWQVPLRQGGTRGIATTSSSSSDAPGSGKPPQQEQQPKQEQQEQQRTNVQHEAQEMSKAFMSKSLSMEELWFSAVGGKLKVWSVRTHPELQVCLGVGCLQGVTQQKAVGWPGGAAPRPRQDGDSWHQLTMLPLCVCGMLQGKEQEVLDSVHAAYLDTLSRAATGRLLTNRRGAIGPFARCCVLVAVQEPCLNRMVLPDLCRPAGAAPS